jgi:membrane-associated phospholipid phosphatase
MPGVVVAAVVLLALTAALGAALVLVAGGRPRGATRPGRGRAIVRTVDYSIDQIGRVATAIVVLLAGFATCILVGWGLGKVAHALEGRIDRPVFYWFASRQLGGSWQHAWNVLTLMGNRTETKLITVVAALLFTAVWAATRRPRPWIPLVAIPVAYLFEKGGQMILKVIVNRGHPPTTNGSWPSGGCARLLFTYGIVIFVALLVANVRSRRIWATAWAVLAFLAMVEAYSRTYLLKHWVTDVAGGLIYGSMGLAVMIAAISVLDRQPAVQELPSREPTPRSGSHALSGPADPRPSQLSGL